MIIRFATVEDFDELKQFYIFMNEVINRTTKHYDEKNAYFPSDEMMINAIENEYQYIGIEDDRIVAALIGSPDCDDSYKKVHWQVEAGDDEVRIIHALRVLPEYSGRGYAKRLIGFLLGHAKENGQKAIRLDVLDGYERPLRMYTELGFAYIDTVEILYEDIGKPERFKLLEKIL